MTVEKIIEKLELLIQLTSQIIEKQNNLPIVALVEQITILSTLFEKIPELITERTSLTTEEIIRELREITKRFEKISPQGPIGNKGKEKVIDEFYKDCWP